MENLKRLRYLVGALVGLALLVWVLRGFDWGEMGRAVKAADYIWLLPAGAAMLGMFALRALRWRLLLGPLEDVKFGALWSGVLIGYLGNFALTANAGELIRAFVLGRRTGVSKSAALASIMIEKTLDILVLVVFLLLLSLALPLPHWVDLMIALAALMLGVAFLFLLSLSRWEARTAIWIGSLVAHFSAPLALRVENLVHAFVTGLRVLGRGKFLVAALVLTGLIWPCLALAFFFIGRSLGLAVAGQAYLLLVTLITLGAIVPTLPGQIGTTEFLIVGGLAVFAVDKEPALTFAILLRLVRLLPLGLGYVALLRAGLRLSDIKAVRQNNLSVSG